MAEKNIVTFPETLYISENGKWYFQNKELNSSDVDTLASQAEALQNLWLWKILVNNSRLDAQTRMLEARSNDDRKDLSQLRQAQACIQVINDFENLLRKLKLSSSRRKTDRDQ